MATTRATIYGALANLLFNSTVWQTKGQRVIPWTKLSAQPAIFVTPWKELAIPPPAFGQPMRYEFTMQVWLFVLNGDPTGPSSTNIGDLIDLVDSLLRGDTLPGGRQTLGGLVEHCWRADQEAIVACGHLGTQSAAVIPVNILVTQLLQPS
jgi:hypothetical protein